MGRIVDEASKPVSYQSVGDTLNILPRNPKHVGKLGDRLRNLRSGAQHLPARLGLTDVAGDLFAPTAERASKLVDVCYDERNKIGFHDIILSE
jgi:hypothetical protein